MLGNWLLPTIVLIIIPLCIWGVWSMFVAGTVLLITSPVSVDDEDWAEVIINEVKKCVEEKQCKINSRIHHVLDATQYWFIKKVKFNRMAVLTSGFTRTSLEVFFRPSITFNFCKSVTERMAP